MSIRVLAVLEVVLQVSYTLNRKNNHENLAKLHRSLRKHYKGEPEVYIMAHAGESAEQYWNGGDSHTHSGGARAVVSLPATCKCSLCSVRGGSGDKGLQKDKAPWI